MIKIKFKNFVNNLLIVLVLIFALSFLIYFLISKNIIQLTYKENINPFKIEKQNSPKNEKVLSQENLTQSVVQKLTDHFISSIVYFNPQTQKVIIDSEKFSPTNIQQLSQEIADKILDNLILKIRQDYNLVLNNLKIEPDSDQNIIAYTENLSNFYQKIKEFFANKEPKYIFENFDFVEKEFQKLITQPVPQSLKENHLKSMKRLIVIKNGLKYIYSLDDPIKIISGLEFMRNLDDNLIENLFKQ